MFANHCIAHTQGVQTTHTDWGRGGSVDKVQAVQIKMRALQKVRATYALLILTWSLATTSTGVASLTSLGPETCGRTEPRSRGMMVLYTHSGSGCMRGISSRVCARALGPQRSLTPPLGGSEGTPAGPLFVNHFTRASSHERVTSSTGKTPASAPHSVLMLAMVSRSSTLRYLTCKHGRKNHVCLHHCFYRNDIYADTK